MKKIIYLLFCACSPFLSFAQVDSLKESLLTLEGKAKLEALNKLTVLDTAVPFSYYHKQAITLATQLKDRAGEANAFCSMGDRYYDIQVYDSALVYYMKGVTVARNYKLRHELIKSLDKSGMALEDKTIYDRALPLYNEALSESRKSGNKKDIASALEYLGIFYLNQRNDSLAFKCLNEQLELTKQLNDSSATAVCLNNIGFLYYQRGEYENCIQHYQKSLVIERNLNDIYAVTQSLINIGITYDEQGTYEPAIKNLLEAISYFEKQNAPLELASCYNTVGLILTKLNETDSALAYHFKALKIRQSIKYKKGIAMSFTNIGETYKEQGKYDSALVYLNRSLVLKNEIGDKALIASSLDLLGEVYFLQKDFIQAENFYLQSMQLKQEVVDPKGKATTMNKLGALYIQWQKYDLAIKNLDEARKIATTSGAKKILLDNYEITITALRAKGDNTEALHYYDLYTELNESILGEQKTKAISELQVKYDTEKKEQRIIFLAEQAKADAAILSKKNTLIISLIISSLLLVMVVLISFKAYRSGVKANKQSKVIIGQKQMLLEQKQNVMKELHHRVKNNLQMLSSLLKLQRGRLEDESTKNAIKAVEHRLNAMLFIHQDLYGESVGSEVSMKEYLQKLIDNLLFSYGYSKDQVKINLAADILSLDPDKALSIGFICNEVISNSFKHAFSKTGKPELTIILKEENDQLHFTLADNGKGMSIENDVEKTNSFGLRLIQMFVKDLQGKLSMKSDQQGSRFEFIIPTNQITL
jgi:two-component sensor histidine kinase